MLIEEVNHEEEAATNDLLFSDERLSKSMGLDIDNVDEFEDSIFADTINDDHHFMRSVRTVHFINNLWRRNEIEEIVIPSHKIPFWWEYGQNVF